MESFDPFDVSSAHSLWSRMADLRQHQPIARLASGVVYISRYRDVREVLRKPQVFASRGGFKADGIYIPIGDASLGQQVFDIAKAQTETVIKPDSVADDFGREPMAVIAAPSSS